MFALLINVAVIMLVCLNLGQVCYGMTIAFLDYINTFILHSIRGLSNIHFVYGSVQ